MTLRDATDVGIGEETLMYIDDIPERREPEPELFGYEVGTWSDGALALAGVLAAIFIIAVAYCGWLILFMGTPR